MAKISKKARSPLVRAYRRVSAPVSEWLQRNRQSFVFVPGIFLVLMSFAAVLAPALLLPIAAAFLFLSGIGFCFLAWKVIQLKQKVEKALKNFEGQLVIQGLAPREMFERQQQRQAHIESPKKVTYH